MNTIIGPPLQNSTESQSLWNNLSGPFPRANAVVVVAAVVAAFSSLAPRASWTRSPCSKGGAPRLLARGEGSEFAKIWGPAQPRPRPLDAQRDDMLAWQVPKAAGEVALVALVALPVHLLTGHIRDLACSLVITIRAGDITATLLGDKLSDSPGSQMLFLAQRPL